MSPLVFAAVTADKSGGTSRLAVIFLSHRAQGIPERILKLMTELRVDDGFVGVDTSPVRYIGMG